MKYEFKIALGFLKYTKGQTIFITLTIGLGVAIQIFISSLIISLQENLIDELLGDSFHILLEEGKIENNFSQNNLYILGNSSRDRQKISQYTSLIDFFKNQKEVTLVVPTLEGTGILRKQYKTIPLNIKGVDLDKYPDLFRIKSRIFKGNYQLSSNNILIGKRLSEDYNLEPQDLINIVFASGEILPFRISGIFDFENPASNSSLAFIHIDKARIIFQKKGAITHLNLQIKNIFEATSLANKYSLLYPELEVIPWTRDGTRFLSALKGQTGTSITIEIVVILGTSMSIASVLLVMVIQKKKQIGILKAMGVSDFSSGLIFVIEGAIIGFMGAFLGSFLGLFLVFLYEIGAKPTFPIKIFPEKIIFIFIISILIGMVASIIPARNCSKMTPGEVIRNE